MSRRWGTSLRQAAPWVSSCVAPLHTHAHPLRWRCCPAVEATMQDTESSNRSPGTSCLTSRPLRHTHQFAEVPTPAASIHTEGSVRLNIKAFEHLSPAQQNHLWKLETLLHRRISTFSRASLLDVSRNDHALVEGHATPLKHCRGTESSAPSPYDELLVMSRVVAEHPAPSQRLRNDASLLHALPSSRQSHCRSTIHAGHDADVFTGVNHALHKRVNAHGTTLRGILKGCAEQNALGAAAASGCAYGDVSDVFLMAAWWRLNGSTQEDRQRREASAHPHGEPQLHHASPRGGAAVHAASIFPCPECWRHLCHVARVRRQHALPPLRLFVYAPALSACTAPSSSSPSFRAVPLLQLAQQRVQVMAEPMEVYIVTS